MRFVSAEPLLEGIRLDDGDHSWLTCTSKLDLEADGADCCESASVMGKHFHGIDWIIVGGESGPGARPCDVEWIRSIVRQCLEADVRCFVKQLGARPVQVCGHPGCEPDYDGEPGHCPTHPIRLRDRKGSDPSEWPDDLNVREFPS